MQHSEKIKLIIAKYWKSSLALFVILYLSFASPSTFNDIPTFQHADKVAHFLMYVFFVSVLVYDFRNDNVLLTSKFSYILVCLVFPIVIGGVIELLQGSIFRPRSAEWLDWLFDITGIVGGFLLMSALLGKLKNNTPLKDKKKNNG